MSRPSPFAALLGLVLSAAVGSAAQAQSFALSEQAQSAWFARWVISRDFQPASARPVPSLVASLLSDRYFDSGIGGASMASGSGFRASGGLVLGAGSASLGLATAASGPPLPAGIYRRDADWLAQPFALGTPSSRAWVETPTPQPYLGLGYTRQSLDGSWAWNADVGMVATNSETWSDWGRALLGPSRLDEAVRNLKLRPILQLGMRYRF